MRLIATLSIGFVLFWTNLLRGQNETVIQPELIVLKPTEVESQPVINETSEVGPQGISPELAGVWKYLAENAEKYRISADVSNLQFVSSNTSLLGTHYHFRQVLGGIAVEQATLVVTANKQGQVTKVYTTMVPVTVDKVARAAQAEIDVDTAYDAAWNQLGAQEEPERGLLGPPSSKLTYLAEPERFRLVYAVDLYVNRKTVPQNDADEALEEPGEWRVYIDAITQEIVGAPIRLSTNHKSEDVEYQKQAGDRAAAFETFSKSTAELELAPIPRSDALETGSGLVFNPDPLTTLQTTTLNDNSPPSAFDAAYQTVNLLEITMRNGNFFLEGPWVRLADFERPNTAPSSTPNGTWTAKRGDLAFNDVMTYFHIDQSQRYLQSLGFNNIQALSIVVDANGVNGDDNSHFIPGTNRLAFGHGCVDDNEDADVILHEYGHAITHGINSSWFGGDSGAIGEGFGDYWAETYSFSTPNGPTFQTFKTFDWDSAGCWNGRRLDVQPSQATYEPNRRYGPHQGIGSGVISDELWATPLYQTHVKLRAAGVPREEIDKIVLQSMFGIGSGFTMRALAENVIDSARQLFPAGTHANEFETQFKALKILP